MGEKIDFALGFLHRRYRSVLIGLLASLPLGLLYYVLTPPSYTASSTMMIETQYNQSKTRPTTRPPTADGLKAKSGFSNRETSQPMSSNSSAWLMIRNSFVTAQGRSAKSSIDWDEQAPRPPTQNGLLQQHP